MSIHESACKVGTPLETPVPKTTAFRTRMLKSQRGQAVKSHGLPRTPACLAASCSRHLQFPDLSHSHSPPLLPLHGWQDFGSHHSFSRSSFLNFFFQRLAVPFKPSGKLLVRLL